MANTELKVYVRHQSDAGSVLLCSIPSFNDLESLRKHLTEVGVLCSTGDVEYTATMQYVVDDDQAYAEIIMGED